MRVLLVDSGNTSVKWRLVDVLLGEHEASICGSGRMSHGESFYDHVVVEEIDRVLVADVSGRLLESLKADFPSLAESEITEVHSSAQLMGVTNCYEDPRRLGVDRFLSAVAAYNHADRACCVVDLGTAAKVDVVDESGLHQGGYIVPGFQLCQASLLENTGKVRIGVDEVSEGNLLDYGRSTADAVHNGVFSLMVAWVNWVMSDFLSKYPKGQIFLAGGDAQDMLPFLNGDVDFVDDLVLQALSRLALQVAE